MKIIPAIDLMDGKVVRLYKGDPNKKTIYGDDPISVAKEWEKNGADMLHLVDLDAALGAGNNRTTIKKILSELSIPIQVAGGLRDEDTIMDISKMANRVVLGTLAFKDTALLIKLLKILGSQKIVISVDHKDGEVVIHGWQSRTGIKLTDAIKKFLEMGFTEFLLTDVNRDGTMKGPDLESLDTVCKLPNCNVISSGGISDISDVKSVKEKNPFGVILGKALYENKVSIQEAKSL